MKKALASIVVIAFAGILCTSMLLVFGGTVIGSQYVSSQLHQHTYFLPY